MDHNVTWDLRTVPTHKLLDMLHEYSQAHAAVSDSKSYSHPDSAHFAAHFYNMRWAVARELENRGYKFNLLPLIAKSILDTRSLRMDRPPVDMAYLLAKGLGEGERWITVHPHGENEPGIPVLIRENKGGGGGATIIGGAGGSLNFVKLTNLKSPAEYREHQKQRQAEKRQAEKERLQGMSPEDREAEANQKAKIDADTRARVDAEVAKVYQMSGFTPPVYQDPEELAAKNNIPVAAAKMALSRERRAHITAVMHLADALRETVLDDHELAAEAGLGDISLKSASDQELWGTGKVSMDLLKPDRTKESSGIKSDFSGRAGEAGATKESTGEESRLIKERARAGQDEEQRKFSDKISENLKNWNEQAKELENTGQVKQNIMKIGELPEPGKILDILKAAQAITQAGQAARTAKEQTKRGVQTNPYVVDTKEITDAAVVKQFSKEAELRAVRGMVARVEEEVGLTKHVRNGSFDALNQVALTLSGQELMGREVVDFIGAAGAAQLLAQRLRNTLSDEDFDAVQTAVSEMHGRDNASIAEEAMGAADLELDKAKQLEGGEAEEAMDVIAARALNEQRMEHVEAARSILGDAYGRLEAMGHLSMALQGAVKGDKEITCDMGAVPKDQAITMARSFGLNPEVGAAEAEEHGIDTGALPVGEGDYRIESGAGKTYITLKPQALEKVVTAFDPQDTKEYEAAQSIKQGKADEDNWLPTGIERRPASTFNDPGYQPNRFDTDLSLGEGMDDATVKTALEDYVGAKVGEGYPFAALLSDMCSEEFRQTKAKEYGPQLDAFIQELRPDMGRQQMTPAEFKAKKEELDQQAETTARAYSEAYKKRRGMTDQDLVSLNTQRLSVEEAPAQFNEAAHRTLAALPESKAAFTKLGDLDNEGRQTLRDYFQKTFGKKSAPKSAQEEALLAKQKERDAAEAAKPKAEAAPPAETPSMFGDEDIDQNAGIKINDEATQAKLKAAGTTAEAIQAENKQKVAQQQAAENPQAAAPDTRTPEQQAWDNYVTAMGSQQAAYETVQAHLRGEAVQQFAGHYGKVFGRPLKVGQTELPNAGRHIQGQLDPEKLKQVLGDRAAEAQSHMAKLASRSGGKFAKESELGDRRKAYDALQEIMRTSQGKLLMDEQFPTMDRPTLGQDAEKQLASVWGNAAEQFSAKKGKVDLIADLSMNGDKIKQQRAVKLALRNKRLGLHMGAGSGKTAVALGTFTEMHARGEAKKAVFAVPSAVQAQFGSEMLRFTTPGKYNWLSDPKATREERMAAYKDDTTHMIVATHQAFRDDLMHAVAEHSGQSPKAVARAFAKMPEEARNAAMKAAMEHLGWKVDFAGVDEAHGISNRQGKPNSAMAAAIDSFTAHMPNYLSMTGTPVKNDASEAFDTLKKLHPERFTDRASFMRKYGVNTPTNWQALQRLMGRYVYADRISSGVERFTDKREVKLHPEQQKEYSTVMSALNKVRQSRRKGDADLEAVQTIAPDAFTDLPEAEHQAKANEIAKIGLGGRINARLLGIVNGSTYENNAKIDAMREDLSRDRDKPHVIFAHHYKSIDHIKRLCDELGMKVGVISGDMSAADKAKVRQGFQPGKGQDARFDVLLNTDAGSTGQNLQRGSILMNYDTPDTAMTHEQRCARIDRIGQTQDVTVRDYFTDTPIEKKARKRLDTKYALADVFQSPSEMLDDTGLAAEIQRVKAEKGNQPQQQQHEQLQAAQGTPEQSPPVPQPEHMKAPPQEAPPQDETPPEAAEAPAAPQAAPEAPAPEAKAQPDRTAMDEISARNRADREREGKPAEISPEEHEANMAKIRARNAADTAKKGEPVEAAEKPTKKPAPAKAPAGAPTEDEKATNRAKLSTEKTARRQQAKEQKNAKLGHDGTRIWDPDQTQARLKDAEDRKAFEEGTAKIKETARQDRQDKEAQETPRQKAFRENQIATTQLENLRAAHTDSLQNIESERQRTGSVSPETQEAHRQLQSRVVAAEERAKATNREQSTHYRDMDAERKKDKAKAQRQESQSRKKATEESNYNHLLNQAKAQGKVTDETEPEIHQIAAAVGKLNPKADRTRNLAHAVAFGSLARIKEAAAGEGDLVKNEPRFQEYAQQILDQIGKQKVKKSLRLLVPRTRSPRLLVRR